MVWQSAVQRVLTLLFMGRQQHLTRMSVGQGLECKWSIILRVTNVCKSTNVGEMQNVRLNGPRRSRERNFR